jgi:hypothetical protein
VRYKVILLIALLALASPALAEKKYSNRLNQILSKETFAAMRQSVVFIYDAQQNPCVRTKTGNLPQPLGTGFFLGLSCIAKDNKDGVLLFIITNKHVIEGQKSVYVRWNDSLSSKSYCYKLSLRSYVRGSGIMPTYFKCSKKEIDLAALWLPQNAAGNSTPTVFDSSMILDRQKMKRLKISEGADVVTAGYEFGYPGIRRMYPVTRFGKISLLSDENWFNIGNIHQQAYMIEIGTTYGASGSPVFLNPTQISLTPQGNLDFRRVQIEILGVVKGIPLTLAPIHGTGSIFADVSPGLAAIEPGYNLKFFVREIAAWFSNIGFTVKLK